ncbi:hypothetical protein HWI79_1575 [Cryptosporidium felis]|nr:hypothetical protein HWI79_1575 [Cryptosporidium felis]
MGKALALELLEFLYGELQRKAERGIYSGDVLEHDACGVLAKLHASKDPFSIYRQELSLQVDSKRKSDNPLGHVIRRLTEELFAIVTTVSYPLSLTPKFYVVYIALLNKLCLGALSPLFLNTFEGQVDKFESGFKPLILEIYIRMAPWEILLKNLGYLVTGLSSDVALVANNHLAEIEFHELNRLFGVGVSQLGFTYYLPLFFASFESFNKGVMEGRYSSYFESKKDLNKFEAKKLPGSPKRLKTKTKTSKEAIQNRTELDSDQEHTVFAKYGVMNRFSWTRMSIAAMFRFFYGFGLESGHKNILEIEPNLFAILSSFELVIVTLLAGSEIFHANLEASNKKDSQGDSTYIQVTSQQVFELDGTASNDIFTLENKVNNYLPFHYLHIQVISGMRGFIKSLNDVKNIYTELKNPSSLIDSVIVYLMRCFNQIQRVIEFQELGSLKYQQSNSDLSAFKFNTYLELVPSEMMLLLQELSKYYPQTHGIFKKKIIDIHVSQLKNTKQRVSTFFISTFIHILRDSTVEHEADLESLISGSWDRILQEIIFPKLLDSYAIDLLVLLISEPGVTRGLSKINMEIFIERYLGVFTRILVYHPDLSEKAITRLLLSCYCNLKQQKKNFSWFAEWTKIVLHIISIPLMSFFPQSVNCNLGNIKTVISPIKPSNRVLSFLSLLVYPKINLENQKKNKPDIKSIICDLPVNLILASIYDSNYSGHRKLHTRVVLGICLKLLKLFIEDLSKSLEDYSYAQAHQVSQLSAEDSLETEENITREVLGLLKMLPYLFHQGRYSLEIQESILGLIALIFNGNNHLLFQNDIYETVLSFLRMEICTNTVIVATLCWVVGEVIVSQKDNQVLDDNQEKILRLISASKVLLESCFLKCFEAFEEIQDVALSLESTGEEKVMEEELKSLRSNSSNSSFLSDSSLELEDIVSDESSLDGEECFGIAAVGEAAFGSMQTSLYGAVDHYQGLEKSPTDFFEEDGNQVANKYMESIYLIEAIISMLCKIGLSSRQLRGGILKVIEVCILKLQGQGFKNAPDAANPQFRQDELMAYSKLIVMKKLVLSVGALSRSSFFSPILPGPPDSPYFSGLLRPPKGIPSPDSAYYQSKSAPFNPTTKTQ